MKWIAKMMVNLQVHKNSGFEGQGRRTLKICLCVWNLDNSRTSGIGVPGWFSPLRV